MTSFSTILKPAIILLKYSSLSLDPENDWLIDILKKHDKLAYTDIIGIPNLTADQQSFLLNKLNSEADRISEEWNSISDVPIPNTNSEQCELCGNEYCNNFYLIKNKHTGQELKVGSSCIKKYDKISKTFGTEGLDKVIRNNRLAQAKYTRENLIIENVGTKEDTFIKWLNQKFDYVLDIDTFGQRDNIIKNFTSSYNNYIEKGTKNSSQLFEELNLLKSNIQKLDRDILVKQKTCAINNLDCPFYIKTWINKNIKALSSQNNLYNFIIDKIMQNSGKLSIDTIKYIYYDRYVNEFIPYFNNKLLHHNISIKAVTNNTLILTVKSFNYDFIIDLKIFMLNFGRLIVDKTIPLDFDKLSSFLSIDFKNENTIEKLINDFNKIMHSTKYAIISTESKYENQIVITNYYLYDKQTKKYASKLASPPDIFLSKCIKFILNANTEEAITGISDIIDKISEWQDFSIIKKYS